MEVIDTIKLNLKNSVVDLQMSEQFLDAVRKAHKLSLTDTVTEKHIKQFLVEAMKNALSGDTNVSI